MTNWTKIPVLKALKYNAKKNKSNNRGNAHTCM